MKNSKAQPKLTNKFSKKAVVIFIVFFAGVASYLLFVTRAATPTANIQAENGTVNSPAVAVTDASASNGSYVQFKAGQQGTTVGRAFTNSSPWNTTVPASATWRDEGSLHSTYWWLNREQYSMPYAKASPSDPLVMIDVPASWGNPPGPVYMRAPSGLTGDSGTDATIVIQSDTKVCDFWQFSRKSDTYATSAAYGCSDVVTGTGWGVGSVGAGIRAAGVSTLGGLILGSDFAAGVKDQALAVSLLGSSLKRGYVYPAISEDGNASTNYTGTVPMGTRLGIPADTPQPTGLSSNGVMIWNALKKYGAYVVDQHYGDASMILYADPRSTTGAQVDALRGTGGEFQKIMPYIRVCTANCI